MHFYTAAAAFLSIYAGLVAAQDATTSTTATQTTSASSAGYTCAAQNILTACLQSTQPQLNACASTDWDCLCDQSTNVLTCYNNCPNHPDQFGAQQTKTSYCNAAAAYGSSSSTVVKATGSSSAAHASSTEATVASTTGGSGSNAESTSTSTSTSSSSSGTAKAKSNGAAGMTVESGSLVAAVLMGLGAML